MFGVPISILVQQSVLATIVAFFVFVGGFLGPRVLGPVLASLFPLAFVVGYYQILGWPHYFPQDPTEFMFFMGLAAVFFDGALGLRPHFGFLETLLVILLAVSATLIPYPLIFVWGVELLSHWPLLLMLVAGQSLAYVWSHYIQKNWPLTDAWIFWILCFFIESLYLLLSGSALLGQLAGLIVALLCGALGAGLLKRSEVNVLSHLGFLVFFFGAFCLQAHLRLSLPWWQVLLLISPFILMPLFKGFRGWQFRQLGRMGLEIVIVFAPAALGLGLLMGESSPY